eukprot:6017709-Amphidinium_carterae.1
MHQVSVVTVVRAIGTSVDTCAQSGRSGQECVTFSVGRHWKEETPETVLSMFETSAKPLVSSCLPLGAKKPRSVVARKQQSSRYCTVHTTRSRICANTHRRPLQILIVHVCLAMSHVGVVAAAAVGMAQVIQAVKCAQTLAGIVLQAEAYFSETQRSHKQI